MNWLKVSGVRIRRMGTLVNRLASKNARIIKYLASIVVGAITLLSAVLAIMTAMSPKLESFHLVMTCNPPLSADGQIDPSARTQQYNFLSEQAISLVEFTEQNAGDVVYLSFLIEASSHVGHCALNPDHFSTMYPEIDAEQFFVELGYRIETSASGDEGGLQAIDSSKTFWISTLDFNAGTTYLNFPAQSSLKSNGLYIKHMDFGYYAVSGPFVAQFSQGNGYSVATFEPLEQSELFRDEVSCAREKARGNALFKNFIPCF